MGARVDVVSFGKMMRELFSDDPPQWVIDARAARAELERTGARVAVVEHLDNTGIECRNVGHRTLVADMRHHDCCYHCNDAAELLYPEEGK
jgi:hypothetical protein